MPVVQSTSLRPSLQEVDYLQTVSFEVFYDRYAAAIYGQIRKSICNKEIALLAFEKVMLELFNGLNQFDSQKETMFVWIFKKVRKDISLQKIDCALNLILFDATQSRQPVMIG